MALYETRAYFGYLDDNPDMIASVVGDSLHATGITSPIINSEKLFKEFGETINLHVVQTLTPRWMDYLGIYQIASDITPVAVWRDIFLKTPVEMVEGLETELQTDNLAGTFAQNNKRFSTSALALGLLGAALGTGVEKCIKGSDSSGLNTAFAVEIGKHFDTPSNNLLTFMQRTEELLPDPTTLKENKKNSLLTYLQKNKTFGDVKEGCPARTFTKVILGEWGRTLHRDEIYRNHFRRTMLRIKQPS